MFEKPVDTVKVYGAKRYIKPKVETYFEPVIIKAADRPVIRKTIKNKNGFGFVDSTRTFNEYQELRQTKEFKVWWWEQHDRQDGYCYYCDIDLDLEDVLINVEHIKPMRAGGTNDYNNMVLSCAPCNKTKGSKQLSKNERKHLRTKQARREQMKELKKQILPQLRLKEIELELSTRKFREWKNNSQE